MARPNSWPLEDWPRPHDTSPSVVPASPLDMSIEPPRIEEENPSLLRQNESEDPAAHMATKNSAAQFAKLKARLMVKEREVEALKEQIWCQDMLIRKLNPRVAVAEHVAGLAFDLEGLGFVGAGIVLSVFDRD